MNQQTEIFELDVTQEDIDNAIARVAQGEDIEDACVISVSAQRHFARKDICSGEDKIFVGTRPLAKDGIWNGGKELAQYMYNFDLCGNLLIKPRKFILTKVGT